MFTELSVCVGWFECEVGDNVVWLIGGWIRDQRWWQKIYGDMNLGVQISAIVNLEA